MDNSPEHLLARPFFFCGIGGSGMLPLAQILKGRGAEVAGSDRSFDQGRTPEKFAALERQGFQLFPQDGSGVTSADQVLIASAAVEDTVPEMIRAKELDVPRLTRADLNAALFNDAACGIGIAGTSGKSTVTAMLGWILHHAGRAPTIMNGAVMKNFRSEERPFASAVVGDSALYVSEVDESDGSIAQYLPDVALLLNVSLDHKSIEELRDLFGAFLAKAPRGVVNADNEEAFRLVSEANAPLTFGVTNGCAALGIAQGSIADGPTRQAALVVDRRDGSEHPLRLAMPGAHNLSNALAAIAGANAAGVKVADAVAALDEFTGIARRFDIVGTSPSGITVIDDFGHNAEKCAATLRTLKRHEGHVIAIFQPHGYGPLRQMGHELAETFARELDDEDLTIFSDPVYFGGTTDRSEGSERIVDLIARAGGHALHINTREAIADFVVENARAGDRVVVMGARDDTLTQYAEDLLARLA